MTRSAARATSIVSVAALGLGGAVAGCSASAASSTSAAPSSASSSAAVPVRVAQGHSPYVLWDCTGAARVEPSSFVLACADGNAGLTGLHWSEWAPGAAAGTGTEYVNDCQPYCAAGHFHNYPVEVRLTGRYLVAPDKPFSYGRITLTYTGARPPLQTGVKDGKPVFTYPASWSERLPPNQPAGAAPPSGGVSA
ncbi:MAG TPA: hypothetical protein VHF26_26500 [Trebonia sp.]|nr:hypothetical protein [Trebonia sp.]